MFVSQELTNCTNPMLPLKDQVTNQPPSKEERARLLEALPQDTDLKKLLEIENKNRGAAEILKRKMGL